MLLKHKVENSLGVDELSYHGSIRYWRNQPPLRSNIPIPMEAMNNEGVETPTIVETTKHKLVKMPVTIETINHKPVKEYVEFDTHWGQGHIYPVDTL